MAIGRRRLTSSRVRLEPHLEPRLLLVREGVRRPDGSRRIGRRHAPDPGQDLRDELLRVVSAGRCRQNEAGEDVVLPVRESKSPQLFRRESLQDADEPEPFVEAKELFACTNVDRLARQQLDPEAVDPRPRSRIRYA